MPKRFLCERCGRPFRADQRLWWLQPKGSIIDSSCRAVAANERSTDPASRFFHHGCLGAPYPPQAPAGTAPENAAQPTGAMPRRCTYLKVATRDGERYLRLCGEVARRDR